ncbi:MAG: sigma-70 family RNA polymerase sigma factor [Acidobacteriia bacterium]|nr:sigma-70 family RNA polymerase sigma factor [Terriglobia bacterium]
MPNAVEQIADQILVIDAQSGKREAFDMLVSRWQKRLWRHTLHLTGSPTAAWDISQETWLEIVRGLRRLNDPARFGAWAFRIASHKAYDWRCRRGHECPPPAEPEHAHTVVAGQAESETIRDVQDALRCLPAPARTVLNLYYVEGFSVAEIAGMLKTPEGTVKSRLHAARIEFRKHWEALVSVGPAALPASGKEWPNE